MKARLRAQLSQLLSRILGTLASLSPRIAFAASNVLARWWTLTARRFSIAQLRALFPHADAASIRREIWRTHVRTQLLGGWLKREGVEPLHTLVRANDAIARLQPPLIIGTFHIGPTFGLGVLSERLHGETLVLRGPQGTTDQERAATFFRAIEQLRSQFVIVALDPREAQRIATPFLGRTLQLARGPLAMARVARVPIVPVVARWDGNAIELIVGDPIAPANDEQTIANAAAVWLEHYLRESPGELSYRVVELMSS